MPIVTKQLMVSHTITILLLIAAGQVQAICNPKVKPTNFEQFKECTYYEPNINVWIVDGDVRTNHKRS